MKFYMQYINESNNISGQKYKLITSREQVYFFVFRNNIINNKNSSLLCRMST